MYDTVEKGQQHDEIHTDHEFQRTMPGGNGNYTNFLTVMMDTKEQVTAAWEIMKEGSTVIYSLESTFYSSARVVFVDRFGIRWGIMTEKAE